MYISKLEAVQSPSRVRQSLAEPGRVWQSLVEMSKGSEKGDMWATECGDLVDLERA